MPPPLPLWTRGGSGNTLTHLSSTSGTLISNDALHNPTITSSALPNHLRTLITTLTTSNHASSLGNASAVTASQILAGHERHIIQIIATCNSSIGLAAAVCAVYWFFMMRRNFRRDLVFLLILGDFWKSLWFLAFAVYTFVHGQVASSAAFCQGAGFLLQAGMEACGECHLVETCVVWESVMLTLVVQSA
jgi:hypothetical protein